MASLPLTEATGVEVIIRTVYQIVVADYRINPEQYDRPATRLYELALQWRSVGLELIADCLQDAAGAVSSGHTIASWKTLHLAVNLSRTIALSRLGQGRRR